MNDRVPNIYGVGLSSVAGDNSREAANAILKGKCFFNRDNHCVGIDGQKQILAAKFPLKQERNIILRMRRLFNEAFKDCLKSIEGLVEPEMQFTLYLSLPAWLQEVTELNLALRENFNNTAPDKISRIECSYVGNSGGLKALLEASKKILNGSEDAAFVCGLDSHITPFLLDALNISSHTLNDQQPYGFIPGEAAAVIFISSSKYIKCLEPLAIIKSIAAKNEMEDLANKNRGIMGKALAENISEVISLIPKHISPELVLCDLNGERYKAEEYGFAIAGLSQKHDAFFNPLIISLSIGDVGAATGIVMIVVGMHYTYEKHNYCVLTSFSSSKERFVASIEVKNTVLLTC